MSLAFDEAPSAIVGVVLTSWRDTVMGNLPSDVPVVSVPIRADGTEDVGAGVHAALLALTGRSDFEEIVIGIDPGRRPGLAVLGDGQLLETHQGRSEREALERILDAVARHDARRMVVRVGNGSAQERDRLLGRLAGTLPGSVFVELVDETGTTPPRGKNSHLPPDVVAAIAIARTTREEDVPGPNRKASGRELRRIQDESRKLTGGRVSISRSAALRVARGEWSLEEATHKDRKPIRTD